MSVKIIVIESDNMPAAMAALRSALAGEPVATLIPGTLPAKAGAIMEEICRRFEVTHAQIEAPARNGTLVLARQVFCYFCRQWTGLSLHEIGRLVRRDHTTVIHGGNRVGHRILKDPDFARMIGDIKAALIRRGLSSTNKHNPLAQVQTKEAQG